MRVMSNGKVRRSVAEWQTICERFTRSGLGQQKFCQREALAVSSFKKWYARWVEHKPQQAELTLSVDEFLRRWSEHVPLPGVPMVRAWGLYESTQRPKLDQCWEQLPGEDTTRETPRGIEAEPP